MSGGKACEWGETEDMEKLNSFHAGPNQDKRRGPYSLYSTNSIYVSLFDQGKSVWSNYSCLKLYEQQIFFKN